MKYFSRLPLQLLVSLSSLAIFLVVFAIPAKADNTGFLSLINSYRQQNGKGALSEDQNLTNAACWFAADMATKNYFPSDHVDSQGRTMSQRLSDFGVGGSRAENIFYTSSGSSANYAFDAWKNSSGHNTNMLSSTYTRIGIGRANYNGKWYWVTDFANGIASSLTNQCGVSTVQPPPPPPPPPAAKKPPPPLPPPPAVIVEPEANVQIPAATIAATLSATPLATKAATKAVDLIELPDGRDKEEQTLVQGLGATTIVLGNLAIFGLIVWHLYKQKKLFK